MNAEIDIGDRDYLYFPKCMILGDSGVGKTSLISSLLNYNVEPSGGMIKINFSVGYLDNNH